MAGGRKKGCRKSGGRVAGTPNKKTIKANEIAEKLGIDPLEVLLLFAKGDFKALGYEETEKRHEKGKEFLVLTIEPHVRMKAAAEATKYMYAQRKAVELKDEDGNSPLKSLSELAKAMTDNELDLRINALLEKK